MVNADPGNPPYHLVNKLIGRHIGPFSTYTDALLARTIGSQGWPTADIMDNDTFDAHLRRSS